MAGLAHATRMRVVLEVMTEAPAPAIHQALSDGRWREAIIQRIANYRWPEVYYETALLAVTVTRLPRRSRNRRKR